MSLSSAMPAPPSSLSFDDLPLELRSHIMRSRTHVMRPLTLIRDAHHGHYTSMYLNNATCREMDPF